MEKVINVEKAKLNSDAILRDMLSRFEEAFA